MKTILAIVSLIVISASIAVASPEINPFTGNTVKPDASTQKITEVTNALSKPISQQNYQYIPPPPTTFSPPVMTAGPQMGLQMKLDDKKTKIPPEERLEVAGIVNDSIVIRDVTNEDKLIYVENYTSLDNGCVVKYPDILCGKEGEKVLRNHNEKDVLSRKLIVTAKENGDLKNKIVLLNKKLVLNEEKIRLLEPKAVKSDSLTKKLEEVEIIKKKIESQFTQTNSKLSTLEYETKNKISTLEKYQSDKERLNIEITSLKKSNGDLLKKITIIEPQLLSLQNEIAANKNMSKEAMLDMSLITDILYNSTMDTDYNIPKLGKFKGVLTKDYFFAFVPAQQREKADVYFRNTNKRAYKTDKYILYINDKKFIED